MNSYKNERKKEAFEAIFEVILGDPRTQEDSRRVLDDFLFKEKGKRKRKQIEFSMEEGKKWKIQLGKEFILTLNDYKL